MKGNDLIRTLEEQYVPLLTKLASDLGERYPGLKFNVYTWPPDFYSVGLECVFPEQSLDQPDNVCLAIDLCHLATRPRLMADVVWGHPSGYTETELNDTWTTQDDWPKARPSTLSQLAESFADLCRAFEEAVRRGHPPSE
jgi:hypothetical protein